MEVLDQLTEDLIDTASPRQTKFTQANQAEQLLNQLIRQHGRKIVEPALNKLTEWWDKLHPPHAGHSGEADRHILLALIESARDLGAMGS